MADPIPIITMEAVIDSESNSLTKPLTDTPSEVPFNRKEALTLLTSIFAVAGCGLTYELLIATVSSYLLGNSITQFSISIGLFIGAMGLGSFLSQRIKNNILRQFLHIELALAVLGGLSVSLLFLTYAMAVIHELVLYGFLITIGTFVGIELPLLTRILKKYGSLRKILAHALTFDYVGALLGSLLFPLLLLPMLGMVRTAFVVGFVNVLVVLWNLYVFKAVLKKINVLLILSILMGLILITSFLFSFYFSNIMERRLYRDQIIYTEQTPYQRIVVTKWQEDLRLFLNGNLQFASIDEFRYHEALVHPAMSLMPQAENVLLLGGGDGLAVRELLKYDHLKEITLVDLDPAMTQLGKTYPFFVEINKNSLNHPKVTVINEDAYLYLERQPGLYDVILSDLPDPNNEGLTKLYSREFYTLIQQHLAKYGIFAAQSTSPINSAEAYWCIIKTVRETGFHLEPYHAYVPSFGDWGFFLAGIEPISFQKMKISVPTQFLDQETAINMFDFPKDCQPLPVEVSTLDHPRILHYYLLAED